MTRVCVIAGGPDAERDVSILSAKGVADACKSAGLKTDLVTIDTPSLEEVRSWSCDVVFPVVHGRFGEGGPLQRLLDQAGHRYVGSGARASRIAMDKLATKHDAARLGVPTLASTLLDPSDTVPPIGLPCVIKPVSDGSSFGLHLCRDQQGWDDAMKSVQGERVQHPSRVSMVEPLIDGRELTVSVIDDGSGTLSALPVIEISAQSGVYDYQSKYERDDTVYTVSPDLSDDLVCDLSRWSLGVCRALGVRHLARVDYLLDTSGAPYLLELNTSPGFTPTSLLPKAASAAGIDMQTLCARLVGCAMSETRDGREQSEEQEETILEGS